MIKDLLTVYRRIYSMMGRVDSENQKASSLAEEVKAFRRLMFSEAEDCIIDKQGRILIPPRLRNMPAEKDVLVAGVENNKIEFWNPAQIWEEAMSGLTIQGYSEEDMELGI